MAKGIKTGGRRAGTPNKTTKELKTAILEAAETAHPEGTVGYLRTLAITNSSAFASLLGKVLPLTIAGDPNNPLKQSITINIIKQGEPVQVIDMTPQAQMIEVVPNEPRSSH